MYFSLQTDLLSEKFSAVVGAYGNPLSEPWPEDLDVLQSLEASTSPNEESRDQLLAASTGNIDIAKINA